MNIVTLSNGKKVGNFSSPHNFTFEDGTILPAVSNETATELKVDFIETYITEDTIELSFNLTKAVNEEILKWNKLHLKKEVDVVLCPLPMITAIKETYGKHFLICCPFRTIRIEDRIKNLCSISKFCI